MDRHTRLRVYGPDERREEGSFYERKKGPEGMQPVNMTAFRQAERRFKVKSEVMDMTGVVDTRLADSHPKARHVRKVQPTEGLRSDTDLGLYEIDGYCGFYLIPAALNTNQQAYWIHRALSSYMNPPNLTNLNAHFEIPSDGLWKYINNHLKITRKPHPDDSIQTKALPLELDLESTEVRDLIRRIRWVTLGYQYDWTTKEYDFGLNPVPFPNDLACWSQDVSIAAGFGSFMAEAGIVNFYQPGDTLTGHVDRSERNMQVPLISMSLGASCIFLLGGADRDDPVQPIFLHSGDIIIMSGPSRSFYHGVPRILETDERLSLPLNDDNPEVSMALDLLGEARININIRQVNM